MVTIKDVARLAGVSTATVSRALSEPGKVSEATRSKVHQAVSECGYVANTLASNFRRRRTGIVVVLVPDISNPFYSSIIQGVERLALKHNYRILLGDTQNNPERERAYSEMVSQRQADGIICLGMNIPFPYRKGRTTVDPNWPPFVMACEYDGVIPIPTVCIDNVRAGQDAVNHLLDLGHRNIAFINGPKDSPICRDRLKGFQAAMLAAGVQVPSAWLKRGDFSLLSGKRGMESILSCDIKPSAVFCANDEMAIGAIQAARDFGLELPRDLSVVGFDDIRFASFTHPALTTIHQPRKQMGEQAMLLMLDILDKCTHRATRVVLSHELIIRNSTVVAPEVN
jgi:LacI family repressor for deo operon, udp, cdd, tsx, nupC, and nupG